MADTTIQSSKELAELIEACPFPVLKCDIAGNILLANPAFLDLIERLKVPKEQASRIFPEEYLPQLQDSLDGSGGAFSLSNEVEGRFLKFTFAPMGSRHQAFVIVDDQTVERQIKEAQAQMIQSEKMASLGQLVAGVAHEINTPIGSINSNNDILIRSVSKMRDFLNCAQCPVEVRESPDVVKIMGVLEEINRNNRIACDRIIEIIRSLKNFARLGSTEQKRVDIHEGIDSSLVLVQHKMKTRIEIVKEYGNLPEIECFPNQLNQVFLNLLVNAEQAMPGTGRLTIRTFRKDKEIVVQISDSGIGISKENLNRIFDPGFTTKGVGVGTGLGLSICYKIIQDHQGKIAAESELGKGTTFTITLPIK